MARSTSSVLAKELAKASEAIRMSIRRSSSEMSPSRARTSASSTTGTPARRARPAAASAAARVNAVQMQDLGLLDQPRRQLRGLQLAEGGHAGQDAALPGGPIHQHDRGLGKGVGFDQEVLDVDPVLVQLPADKVAEGVVTNLAGAGHRAPQTRQGDQGGGHLAASLLPGLKHADLLIRPRQVRHHSQQVKAATSQSHHVKHHALRLGTSEPRESGWRSSSVP